MAELALDCGSHVVPAGALEHDAAVASVSHLPHVLAYALVVGPLSFTRVVVGSTAPKVLLAADPIPPERPPKSSSPI